MPLAIVIPADEDQPLESRLLQSLDDYYEVVGGLFEAVDTEEPHASFFVNEEGKLIDLPLNRRATLLWWGTTRAARNADVLMGDVLIVGPPDDEGETTDVPAEVLEMLFPSSEFRVEVETLDTPGAWNGNQARYSTCFDAWNAAFSLMERWMAVTDIRIVAA